MEISIIKFGGSSVADNDKLKEAAKKTISFLEKGKKVVAVLSAQGKTTDKLIKEALELTNEPNKREMDMLVSVGEQVSCAKFAILLQSLGYKAVSLTGWQAGIITNNNFGEAKITQIYPSRILDELEKHDVVIIAGFQGLDNKKNITTLGRNGSDTTALAITAALNQRECYIFTNVDGVYDKDPYKYKDAKKIDNITYDEMLQMAENGAKVLHNRCIKIAKKYNIKIIVKSTFTENYGTIVN